MKDKLIGYARAYSKRGFSVIPVDKNKQPAIKSWKMYQTRVMTDEEIVKYFSQGNAYGIALLTGGRNKITGLDFDLKYDLTGNLFDRYKREVPVELLKKMTVHKTKNDGYHFLFTSDSIEPNRKLASRYTTDKETWSIFKSVGRSGKGVRDAMQDALNDKIRVLIETRGGTKDKSGGYVVVPPTPGYEHITGKLQHINEEDYDILFSAARSFEQVTEEFKDYKMKQVNYSGKKGNSPFDNFNKNGDGLAVLYAHGWKNIRETGGDVRLLRPGQTHSSSSALYDKGRGLLSVFTTSTAFKPTPEAYSNSDIFILLEHNGDVTEAYKHLIKLGFKEERE